MELKRAMITLWKRKWLFFIVLLIAFVSTAVFTYTQVPTYETTIRLIVSPSNTGITDFNDLRSAVTSLSAPVVANTYAEIAQSSSIVEKAWQQLNSSPQKQYVVTSTVLQETTIVVIKVSGPNPNVVQELGTAITNEAVNYVNGLTTVYNLTLLDPAVVPDAPTKPNYQFNLALGLLTGVMAGILLAFMAEYVSAPVSDKATVPSVA
ncbi:MAG: Wzz/FepE/Etk N-terminal domain-containing protein [Anaerolineales bacterium]